LSVDNPKFPDISTVSVLRPVERTRDGRTQDGVTQTFEFT
jgi:hypothetical protein